MPSFDKLKQRWRNESAGQSKRAVMLKRQLLEKGTPIFKKYGIDTVILFGSVANGRCREKSDIDLYVTRLQTDRYWQFRYDLEEAVQLPIDLYTDSDDHVFIQKIVARGEKIYGL